jgi:hypothetical protein
MDSRGGSSSSSVGFPSEEGFRLDEAKEAVEGGLDTGVGDADGFFFLENHFFFGVWSPSFTTTLSSLNSGSYG